MEDENIVWKEIGAASFSNEQKEQAVVEPCKMEYYPSLYAELKVKCNPERYMSPYNKEKVDIANKFYQELLDLPEGTNLRPIRNKVAQRLGITFSTKRQYEQLLKYCNPKRFMNPYDFEKVQLANHYYSLAEEYRNDIHKLEELRDEISQINVFKDKSFDEEMEDYLKKERNPNTIEADEMDWGTSVAFFVIGLIYLFFMYFVLD